MIRSAIDITNKDVDFNAWRPQPPELSNRPSPLYIKDDEEALTAYLTARKEDPATSQFISEAEASRLRDAYGAVDWYGWRIQNWGTKWTGILLSLPVDTPNLIVLRMDTAWCEPQELFVHLDNKFPDLSILAGTIYEDGSEFAVTYGEATEYLRYFNVTESVDQDIIDGKSYTFTDRSIHLRQ